MSPLLLTLSRRCIRLAAALLVAAVFSVPYLAYAHDHLSTSDSAHFRPGKNIERPHEQRASVEAATLRVAHVPADVSGGRSIPTVDARAIQTFPGSPVPSRAPPAR